MTFALTSFVADGVEVEEAVTKRFRQRALFTITAANTDTALDIGNYSGTFWTAVGGSTVGAKALLAIKDIQTRARAFNKAGGTGLAARAQADASIPTIAQITSGASVGGNRTETMTVTGLASTDTILNVEQTTEGDTKYQILSFLSNAAAGGASSETLTVTGLAATDVIQAVTQEVKNGTATVAFTGWDTQGANSLKCYFSADPGAGGKVRVLVKRAGANTVCDYGTPGTNSLDVTWATDPGAGAKVTVTYQRAVATVQAGTYQLALNGTNAQLPDITFASGDAPTAYTIVLEWELKNDEPPVEVAA